MNDCDQVFQDERRKRDSIPWASKLPGWIDFAFRGDSTASISEIINKRAREDGSGVEYLPEMKGRERPDGKMLEWLISAPGAGLDTGSVPFFCGDITPREWRVPLDPPSNTQHPSTALGIAHLRVLVDEKTITTRSKKLTSIIGSQPIRAMATESTWLLDTPTTASSSQPGRGNPGPHLILSSPKQDNEHKALKEKGPGIYEVEFWVEEGHNSGGTNRPYGKIVWRPGHCVTAWSHNDFAI